jgi:hypothetical protein
LLVLALWHDVAWMDQQSKELVVDHLRYPLSFGAFGQPVVGEKLRGLLLDELETAGFDEPVGDG